MAHATPKTTLTVSRDIPFNKLVPCGSAGWMHAQQIQTGEKVA